MTSKATVPYTGCILISNPFLDDPYFSRTVVLLLAHNQEGSFGVILNQKTNYEISFSQTEKSPLFKGYSGWESEQLQGEINNQQWIVTQAKDEYLAFHHSDLWQHIINDIGGNLPVVAKAAEKIKLN